MKCLNSVNILKNYRASNLIVMNNKFKFEVGGTKISKSYINNIYLMAI